MGHALRHGWVLTLLLWTAWSTSTAGSEADRWAVFLQSTEVLENGTREEKLALFDHDRDFGPVEGIDSAPGDEDYRRAIARLHAYVNEEKDAWILSEVLSNVDTYRDPRFRPIVRDLVHHPAPSLRLLGLWKLDPYDYEEELRLLEWRWSRETVPWLQTELLALLEEEESEVHVEDCEPLMWHHHRDLAVAAVSCVGNHVKDEVPAELVRRALHGDDMVRLCAMVELTWVLSRVDVGVVNLAPELLESLESLWADGVEPWMEKDLLLVLGRARSREAAAAALPRVNSKDRELAEAAIEVLGLNPNPDTERVLMELATSGAERIRFHAIYALGRDPLTPEAEVFLARMATDLLLDPSYRQSAVSALANGDRSFHQLKAEDGTWRVEVSIESREHLVGLFERVMETDPDLNVRHIAAAAVTEVREKTTVPRVCPGIRSRPWEKLEIVADEGVESLRCLAGPNIPYRGRSAGRVVPGKQTIAGMLFDDGRSVWRRAIIDDEPYECWLSAESFRPIHPSEYPGDWRLESTIEFDLSLEVARNEIFRALVSAGVVETFDPDEHMIGVRLVVDVRDEAALATLRDATGLADTPLRRTVDAILPEISERYGSLRGWEAWDLPDDD